MSKYSAMQFAIRPATVARLLADMYGVLALLTLVPTGVAALSGSAATGAYSVIVVGMALFWLAGRGLPHPVKVQTNEALVMVALLFISASLLMAIPITAYGVPYIDAWFEAVSAVTTTGLSVLDVDAMPAAFKFGRAWTQWVGGIGVVVLALAIFVRPGATAHRLGFSDREMDDVVGGTRAHARRVIIVYLLITAAGVVALLLSGASGLDAVAHSMAALSTGGFANHGDSLASVSNMHLWVVNGLCIAGAVSFHLYYRSLLLSKPGNLFDNQLYSLLAMLLAVAGAAWLLAGVSGIEIAPGDLLSLVISAQTTAGFSTLNVAALPSSLLLLLCLSMAVGGGIGSTSGGIKLDRALTIARVGYRALVRSGLPDQVHVRGRDGERGSQLEEVLALVFWFLVLLMGSWMVFVAYGYPPLVALFEVTSALATVGLSAGLTSAELPTELKILLCGNMLLGRLEILAVLVLLSPRSWIGYRRKATGGKP